MNCSTPGLPVHHQFRESTHTHVHRVGEAIQPSHPLLSPSPPTFSLLSKSFQKNECGPLILWRVIYSNLMLLNCGVGEDSWESLDCKEIQPVHPKGDQSWVFFGRTDVEAETPILWPPDAKSWLIWKDHDAGNDWGQEEKGMTEDEMVGWHHWLDGHEFG